MSSFILGLVEQAMSMVDEAEQCETRHSYYDRQSAKLYRADAADKLEQAADLFLANN